MRKVYYISIDNLDKKFVGCFGGAIQTKFIDILSEDSFVFNKHFCSSQDPIMNFFSVVTGKSKPDLDDDCDLISLMTSNFAGVCNVYQKDIKKFNKQYQEIDLINFIVNPMDIVSTSIQHIKNPDCGFYYCHYSLINEGLDSYDYPQQVIKMDSIIGKLLAGIEEFDDYDDSYIVMSASSGETSVPCLFKIPNSTKRTFYNSPHIMNYVSRDIDILPTVFDMEGEYQRLPVIDGVSVVNNILGKDQKLTAYVDAEKAKIFNHKGINVI